jgi:hypothetical protein
MQFSNRRALLLSLACGATAVVGVAGWLIVAEARSMASATPRAAVRARTTAAGTQAAQRNLPPAFGYLYVLDSGNDRGTGQVIMIDLVTSSQLRAFPAGQKADFVLSPNGLQLYVQSRRWDQATSNWVASLDTFDTKTGVRLAHADSPDPVAYISPVYPTRMKISASGDRIFVLKNHQTVEADEFYLTIFDTRANQFLPQGVLMPGCRQGEFFPAADGRSVAVACRDDPTLHEVYIGSDGLVESERQIVVPAAASDSGFGAGARLNGKLAFVTQRWQGVSAPTAKMSARASIGCPSICSGAM